MKNMLNTSGQLFELENAKIIHRRILFKTKYVFHNSRILCEKLYWRYLDCELAVIRLTKGLSYKILHSPGNRINTKFRKGLFANKNVNENLQCTDTQLFTLTNKNLPYM